MRTIPFIKMHGCGNDYIYLDGISHPIPSGLEQIAKQVSDRNRSIGGDGLVVMLPATVPGAAARMRMFNADGSEGSLCGNALRCMALWLHQTRQVGTTFQIEMSGRLIDVTIIESDGDCGIGTVRVHIGIPVVQSPQNPTRWRFVRSIAVSELVPQDSGLRGENLPDSKTDALHVSMGNPHTILFVLTLASCDVHRLGPIMESHPLFPDRTNVEFAEVIGPSALRVRVWERGSGETMACGSGACAVAVAALASGLVVPGRNDCAVHIEMLGGTLKVIWHDDDCVSLEGPAEISFEGHIKISHD